MRLVREEEGLLEGESLIVWLEPIDRFDYVRQTIVCCTTGSRRPRFPWRGSGRMVGYSNASRSLEPWSFYRRVFWVKPHDRSEQPDGCYKLGGPVEAVNPKTVEPGKFGSFR